MAIDFTKKATESPTDPQAVVSLVPSINQAWIKTDKDGAWQGTLIKSDTSPGPEYRSVGYAVATLNNGDTYNVILDGSGQPISEVGDRTGTDTGQSQRWAQTGPKPLPPGGNPTQRRQAADGQMHIYGYNTATGQYDDDQGIVQAALSPAQQAQQTATAQTAQATAQSAQAENQEKQWNSDHGYGWVTHAQRAEQVRQQEESARAAQNQQRITAAQEAANQLQRDRLQFDKDKANLPENKVEPITVNGAQYTRVTSVYPGGRTVIKSYGPDNKEIAAIPTTGAASVGGPPMPQIIAGHISEALTAYHGALWNDPSLTPEQRITRFKEFESVATAAQNQANEHQRERESQRNADYNTASTKLTYLENSTQAALTFTQGLIGKVKPGSGAAGAAFAALMGLQALNMKASGINDLKSTVNASQLALNNPQKLAEQTQQIAAQVAQAVAPATTATTTTPSLGQGQDLSTPVARPTATTASAPQTGAVAAPASAAPTATTLPANRPDQTQAAPQIENAINPPQGAATSQSVGGRVLPQPTTTPVDVGPQSPLSAPYQDEQRDPATPPAATDPTVNDPNYQQPQYTPPTYVTKPADVPPGEVTPGEVTQTQQQSEWAALAALQQQQQAEATAQPQAEQQQTSYSDSPALLHAEAASKPFWMMSKEEYERYKAAGIPDEVIKSIPGRAAA